MVVTKFQLPHKSRRNVAHVHSINGSLYFHTPFCYDSHAAWPRKFPTCSTMQSSSWLSWYRGVLDVANRLPVVVRFLAGPRARLKTVDPPKGNGLGQKKNPTCNTMHCICIHIIRKTIVRIRTRSHLFPAVADELKILVYVIIPVSSLLSVSTHSLMQES